MACQSSIEMEIRNITAVGEETKIFIDNDGGIWFKGIIRRKLGILHSVVTPTKPHIGICLMFIELCTPHQKTQVLNLPKWGGGIPLPQTVTAPVSNPSSLPASSTTAITNEKTLSKN